jgi:hypothetical protein
VVSLVLYSRSAPRINTIAGQETKKKPTVVMEETNKRKHERIFEKRSDHSGEGGMGARHVPPAFSSLWSTK